MLTGHEILGLVGLVLEILGLWGLYRKLEDA